MKRTLVIGSAIILALAATSAIALASTSKGGPGKGGPRGDIPQAFKDCMAAQGVTKPARGSGPPSAADRAKLKAALDACKQHLPEAIQKRIEAMQAFGACMQAKGITRPERGSGRLTAEQRDQLRAAAKDCADKLGIELPRHGPHGKGSHP